MKYTTLLLLFNVYALLGQKTSALYDQQARLYEGMKEGLGIILFLKDCYTNSIDSARQLELTNALKATDLFHSPDAFVRIANDTFHFDSAPNRYLFKSRDRLHNLYIEEVQNTEQRTERWRVIQPMQQVFWGYGGYYFKFDTLYNASLNVMFSTKKHVITIQKAFPFKAQGYDGISNEQWTEIHNANTEIIKILKSLSDILTTDADKIYAPSDGRLFPKPLTSTERLIGFVNFWTEVKYNFAFFDQVPDLNWDEVLATYLPKVAAEQSTYEYYHLLSEVCAKLKDGHTNVYFPEIIKKRTYSPHVELRAFDDGIYVVNTTKKYSELLPLGSKVTKVEGEPISGYMQNRLFPFISSSTQHIKVNIALRKLLEIPSENKLTIGLITPQGKEKNYVFSPDQDTSSWIIEEPEMPIFEMLNNNTAYLQINDFESTEGLENFLKFRDSIVSAKKLIIDLRGNTGGNSNNGYEILKYLSPKPFLTSKWMTREHKAAYKAWGASVTNPAADPFEEECLLTFKGNYWHVSPPDTIEPYYDKRVATPVVILIGNNTASAAEDFLVAADNAGLTETVGDFTFGSTGQPLHMRLPGGGTARICTKKDTYPDGKEFVGYGIKPKYLVKNSLKDVLENRDRVLEFALNLWP
jgi:C-terminal processing protease CtpA/Prc